METDRFYNLLGNQNLLSEETTQELKKLTSEYPWFQLGRMLYLKNLKETESQEYQEELKKVAVQVTDRKLLYNFLNAEIQKRSQKTELEQSIQDLNEDEKENGNPLINKFLSSKPGKIIGKTEGEEVMNNAGRVDIAEKSDAENDDIITETLAAIYVQQKSYEKALAAYKKLSLKYPEKSIYFATQIEEIEKLKNTNL